MRVFNHWNNIFSEDVGWPSVKSQGPLQLNRVVWLGTQVSAAKDMQGSDVDDITSGCL